MKFQGHPMVTAWWDVSSTQSSGFSSELIFLMHKTGDIAKLAKRDKNLQNILIDGPYGQDIKLHEFENVILAAKGMGIAGILPYALHLTSRQLHDHRLLSRRKMPQEQLSKQKLFRDKTRKVDLFWVMDENSQQEWLSEQLQALQKLDPKNRLFAGSDIHEHGIFKEIGTGASSPGKSVVVSCGGAAFTSSVRSEVIRNASMQFVEVEYRPSDTSHLPEDLPGTVETIPLKRILKHRSRALDPERLAFVHERDD
ncbi:hypothetical protein DL768_010483 [Monosporascus sp. mg162]|nr:hypothetical protein DL768_010483 [Monosporascus sp. mg162]